MKSKIIQNKKYILFFMLFITAIILVILFRLPISTTFDTKKIFNKEEKTLESYYVFDVGIVDINNDSNLDIYTANHSFLQTILLNRGEGQFTSELSKLRLSQNPDFPNSEISNEDVKANKPGLYIYRMKNTERYQQKDVDNVLVIEAKQLKSNPLIKGKIQLYSPVFVKSKDGFHVNIDQKTEKSGLTKTIIDFNVPENGKLIIESQFTTVPTHFNFSKNMPLNLIHIGTKKIPPKAYSFNLYWRDRHGMAWSDINGNGKIDVYITRGGIKGLLASQPDSFDNDFYNDELMFGSSNGFRDQIHQVQITKNGCPGRQTSWVDYDGDGLLDIYTVCGRSQPPGNLVSNQLYHQESNGKFTEVGHTLGLDHLENGTFVWLDFDADGDLDFLWGSKSKFELYLNKSDRFERILIGKNIYGEIRKFSISDFDMDGDLDVFSSQQKRSTLLINSGESFTILDPSSIGLPSKNLTANWVDYDNDGLPDLHAIPTGLYRQNNNHQFQATGILKQKFSLSRIAESKCNWFDMDNDGSRDLLLEFRPIPLWHRIKRVFYSNAPDPRDSKIFIYKNKVHNNHWLEVNLIGKGKNPQAIGALVSIKTPNGIQFQQVGQSEGSHFSQGHYRLYFGLGQNDHVDVIEVAWPNGNIQTLEHIDSDRLLTIRQSA